MQTLNLSAWTLEKGAPKQSAEGLAFTPNADGEVALSLAGTPGSLGGLVWSPEDYLIIDFCADMDRMSVLLAEFEEQGGDPPRTLTIRNYYIPGRRVKFAVQLSELDSHRFFLPTLPGGLKGHVQGAPTHIGRIGKVRIRLAPNDSCRTLTLYGICLSPELPDMRVPGAPMVDPMGQRVGYDWPDKMHSAGEMTAYLRRELADAQQAKGYPEGWSRWGGWKAKRFDATGFFHTHHDGRRWWLVDPDGYAFFSNGVCYGSRMGVHGFVDRMESLFEWLPDRDDPTYRDCWTTADQIAEFVKRNGAEAGKGRAMFNFPRANMIRAFGPEHWWDAWVTINANRLKTWGLNTVGVGVNNYFDEKVLDYLKKAEIPFVWTLKEFPLTQPTIFRDFPDVFSPEYAKGAERFAQEQLAPLAGNPYFIGYFITNEPEWMFQSAVNPAERVLAYDGPLYSKDALIDFLKDRYHGDIAAFNRAWDTTFDDFDDLRTPLPHADRRSEAANRDLTDFRDVLIRKYSQVPSDALRAVGPQHLNLGMRYAGLSPNELAGNGCFDICSFNCYQPTPAPRFDILAEKDPARPGLVGEWHIAGDDMRCLATGLLHTHGQADRTTACIHYLEQGLAHPMAVGMHYFEMNDQPVLGRFDGECMQHGLISLCNKPYSELTAALTKLGERLYPLVNGDIAPTETTATIMR